MSYIGESTPRKDARSKVTGAAKYAGDLNKPNQVYLKILFSRYPHAIVKSVDIREALRVEGVLAILTAKDVPKNEYGLETPDQPVLCGPGSEKPYTDRVRFVGDQIAAVIAESEKIGSHARDLIDVEYNELPVVPNPSESPLPGTPLLHPDRETNLIKAYQIQQGDVEQGFQDADVIVESEYHTPPQEHAYLEPEAGISYIDEKGRVTILAGGQWAHEEKRQVAHALELDKDQVRIIHPAIGSAFGGREDMSIQIMLGLAALHLHQRGIHRPVKIVWDRKESILGHPKRHPTQVRTKWGATKSGKILAAEFEITMDGGAYVCTTGDVLASMAMVCAGPYQIPNIFIDAKAWYTNNIPGGAFRGFGAPQGAFVAECQVNKIADALSMDPVETRLRNVIREGSHTAVQSQLPKGVSMPNVLSTCATNSFWTEHGGQWTKTTLDTPEKHRKKGIGVACGFKNVGFFLGYQESSQTTIELYGGVEIEHAVVRHAAAELGQGTFEVIAQMAAEALHIPLEIVHIIPNDTAETEDAGSNTASRMTFMSGNSIRGAAKKALQKWHDEERPAVATYRYLAPTTTGFWPESGERKPCFALGYSAQAVEVEVDMELGQIKVLSVTSATDVGKAINPQQVEGQIEGALVQALGYTLTENFTQENGCVKTDQLSTYLIPTAGDIPNEINSIILEENDPNGPWGAKGMGEMPFLPFAPALTAAVHDATGVWYDDFPLTPERVKSGLDTQ